ncbi:YlmC/YmxH family sporulation protein [Mesobacillus harenae]|uniref:YlmC/YmxH family sporulation protein n=1 Tax=Mesobacillus harenae TaxID=2213203 RepID=UPI00157FCA1C|nr:YlmC/YmxH family sporulation protein [Mesobacillus harenae]
MIKVSDFQIKDVVNVADGKKLGNIEDFEINLTTGKIEAVVIGGPGKMLGFFAREDAVTIPWRNILKIGHDVILVRYMDTGEVKYKDEEA